MEKTVKYFLSLALFLSLSACSGFKSKNMKESAVPGKPAANPSAIPVSNLPLLGSADNEHLWKQGKILEDIVLPFSAFTEEELNNFAVVSENSLGEIVGLIFAKGEFLGVERPDGLAELAEMEDVLEPLHQTQQNYCVLYTVLEYNMDGEIKIRPGTTALRHALSEMDEEKSTIILDGWYEVDLSAPRSSRPQIKTIKCVKFTKPDTTLYEDDLIAAVGIQRIAIEKQASPQK